MAQKEHNKKTILSSLPIQKVGLIQTPRGNNKKTSPLPWHFAQRGCQNQKKINLHEILPLYLIKLA